MLSENHKRHIKLLEEEIQYAHPNKLYKRDMGGFMLHHEADPIKKLETIFKTKEYSYDLSALLSKVRRPGLGKPDLGKFNYVGPDWEWGSVNASERDCGKLIDLIRLCALTGAMSISEAELLHKGPKANLICIRSEDSNYYTFLLDTDISVFGKYGSGANLGVARSVTEPEKDLKFCYCQDTTINHGYRLVVSMNHGITVKENLNAYNKIKIGGLMSKALWFSHAVMPLHSKPYEENDYFEEEEDDDEE